MLIWGLTEEEVLLVLIVFISIFIHADQVSYLHIIHPVNETMIVRLTADRHIHHFYILNSRLLNQSINQSINQKHVLLINKGWHTQLSMSVIFMWKNKQCEPMTSARFISRDLQQWWKVTTCKTCYQFHYIFRGKSYLFDNFCKRLIDRDRQQSL